MSITGLRHICRFNLQKMNLLLTGCFNYTEEQFKQLQQLGYSVYFMQQEKGKLPLSASEVDAVVCNGLFLSHSITEFTRLKYIQLTSAGLDRVPMDYVKEHGIEICNARGVYSVPMAEWVLFRLLEHYKHALHFNAAQKANEWLKDRGLEEISGKRCCIVGAGNVGCEVAKRLSAMGCSVIGYDLYPKVRQEFDEVRHIDNFVSDLHSYDIVILTAPHTPETHHLLNAKTLAHLRTNAVIVNIARGGLVDENALIEILRQRQDLFAVLDVFEQEPLSQNSPLWSLPNVALSPHNSFVSNGNNKRMFRVIESNLRRWSSKD